ncbi:MAG: orotidine-5'-phosphate decarboxylase [Thermodesulfobacteriota bacterium]|jgi:orotidine-5'-phosphate decarboxylase|nr:MAG: orotidine-5'-phosphate decarboxylase [Thermodesulfobacteriota bacterium]
MAKKMDLKSGSSKKPHEYIIFPLDLPTLDEATHYVRLLKNYIGLFKVGLELFVKEGPKILRAIAEETPTKIFLDMKFHDIPETVSGAQKAANAHHATFITVHCEEGKGLLKAVVDSVKNGTKILGITVLTSLSKEDLKEIGIREDLQDPTQLVLHRARLAKLAGCSGVVCSGKEVKAVKQEFGKDFIVVVPAIRPKWSVVNADDQKRITTPYDAIKDGADYIVVGRPIKNAPDPIEAVKKIAKEIEQALS